MPYSVNDSLDPDNLPAGSNLVQAINILATQVKQLSGKSSWRDKPDYNSAIWQKRNTNYVISGNDKSVIVTSGIILTLPSFLSQNIPTIVEVINVATNYVFVDFNGSKFNSIAVSANGSIPPLMRSFLLFFDSSIGWTDINNHLSIQPRKLIGTPFGASPSFLPENGYTQVFDGDTTTWYDYAQPSGGYCGIDLGVGNSSSIVSIRFMPRPQIPARMWGGKFQGSNSGNPNDYIDIYTISSTPSVGWNEVSFTVTNPYRYLKYLALDGTYNSVVEIEFYGY